MITDVFQLRPRYGEVDQMRYVYHANYVTYCHQARNELLRKLGLDEITLDRNHVILPVISFEIFYKNPAHYDELISIKTTIRDTPKVRLRFEFEVKNEQNILVCKAQSAVVFVDSDSRLPMRLPNFIKKVFENKFKNEYT